MEKTYFTVQEARSLLPKLRNLLGKAAALSQELEAFRPAAQHFSELSSANSGGPEGTAYLEVVISLQNNLLQIQELGCIVKSIQDGLVDFPHWREGREVYLCWKIDEDDIRYWHEVEAGFAGRTPLLE